MTRRDVGAHVLTVAFICGVIGLAFFFAYWTVNAAPQL